jgi:hypothetical protein
MFLQFQEQISHTTADLKEYRPYICGAETFACSLLDSFDKVTGIASLNRYSNHPQRKPKTTMHVSEVDCFPFLVSKNLSVYLLISIILFMWANSSDVYSPV